MPTIVRVATGPLDAVVATEEQEQAIDELKKQHPQLLVIPHELLFNRDALVALNRFTAVWIKWRGEVVPADKPYPFCSGNPTVAHCVLKGYCTRDYACSE